MKLFERAIRRAEIPIKMSEGFNPRPKIIFPLALPVGIKGADEKLGLVLSECLSVDDVESRLKEQLPEGIQIISVELVSNRQSSIVSDITYRVKLKNEIVLETIKIEEFLSRSVIYTQRNGKKQLFDIKPSIINVTVNSEFITLDLKMTPKGMARPEEVLSCLGLKVGKDYVITDMVRTRVNLSSSY
ncbi:MAG: TIGR03936 family radical SAM-associated protein [Candidatus Scalindua sp.]|nr:TIGR03936 family radical SAM-associated protein [Candidatus Scalindua sp.]